jgi:hypothetical protein
LKLKSVQTTQTRPYNHKPVSKDELKYHVLVLTDENGLVYSCYDHEVTHLSIYHEYIKYGVKVKDCYIEHSNGMDVAKMLVLAVARHVEGVWAEPIDVSSLSLQKFRRNNQYVILGIRGKTESGHSFYVSPSSIIPPEKNFFSEIC